MTTSGLQQWMRPVHRLHGRQVEKRVKRAETAAAALSVEFDARSVRTALELRWDPYLLRQRRLLVGAAILGFAAIVTYKPACRPGGVLDTDPASCVSYSAYVLGSKADPQGCFLVFCGVWVLTAAWTVWRADNIARCHEPLYPLLSLLCACGELVGNEESRYTDAAKLRKKVHGVQSSLRELAADAASVFGADRTTRKQLAGHAQQVNERLAETANELMRERGVAAKKLGLLAATVATNVAADRFHALLPETLLSREESGEGELAPDRVDGLRLAKACGWSTLYVMLFSLFLALIGAPAELMVPLAVLEFPVAVYVSLSAQYGLNEAARLTRTISAFFSGGPPV